MEVPAATLICVLECNTYVSSIQVIRIDGLVGASTLEVLAHMIIDLLY